MDSNLNHSSADEWNRPAIDGRTSCLNQAQLIADFAPRCLGEPPQAVTTVSEPFDRFCAISHAFRLYRIFIIGIERDLLVYPAPKWRSANNWRHWFPKVAKGRPVRRAGYRRQRSSSGSMPSRSLKAPRSLCRRFQSDTDGLQPAQMEASTKALRNPSALRLRRWTRP